MYRTVEQFMRLPLGQGALPLALVVSDGIQMTTVSISNQEGTFLAHSSNPRARVVAALTGLHEMSLGNGYARSW